jgi:hypothetical protein
MNNTPENYESFRTTFALLGFNRKVSRKLKLTVEEWEWILDLIQNNMGPDDTGVNVSITKKILTLLYTN